MSSDRQDNTLGSVLLLIIIGGVAGALLSVLIDSIWAMVVLVGGAGLMAVQTISRSSWSAKEKAAMTRLVVAFLGLSSGMWVWYGYTRADLEAKAAEREHHIAKLVRECVRTMTSGRSAACAELEESRSDSK